MAAKAPGALEPPMRLQPISRQEVDFAEPWQVRAFAIVLALVEGGHLDWEDFRGRLIDQIARADPTSGGPGYYESWLSALESVLTAGSVATAAEIEHRAETIAANPPAPTKAISAGPIRIV